MPRKHAYRVINRVVRVRGHAVWIVGQADAGKNRFTLTVMADDKRIEKRDKTVNEPVQFYVMGTRQPYEIVVNQVHKDRVVGYLATPKSVDVASR